MADTTESDWIRGRAQALRRDRAPIDLEALLDLVVVGVAGQLEAERATLYLLHAARGELVSRVATGLTDLTIRLAVGEGVAGRVAMTGESARLLAMEEESVTISRFDALTNFDTRSLLAVPVHGGDGVLLGVLQVLNADSGGFTPEDEESLFALATQVGALLDATSLRSQLQTGQQPLAFRFNGIVGESNVMQRVYDRAARAARTDATVLIRGASGTGKELVARAVHANSERSEGPLVKVDCGALPEQLVENELFGHERGAFTGASTGQDGKIAAADGGTLFLDEIGELPLVAQTRLLRFLQDRSWFRVGGTKLHSADVRVVAASHRDLEDAVAQGAFRQDLYYRLRVVEITLPDLRARGHGDLDRLIDHFFWEATRRYNHPTLSLSGEARALLHAHSWPGNVRELEHVITSAVVLAPGTRVLADGLELGPGTPGAPAGSGPALTPRAPSTEQDVRPLAEIEREYLVAALRACGGNRSEAARRLGIGRNTLLRKLKGPASVP
ncbi:MAG: sigma-54-dependent Fis family transcriptional regulator [Deltaproteobacteria bacterium]|nr:sigma-54-dependent Fis family transcriptional regulator [Deltaproteobacteria bacterium]